MPVLATCLGHPRIGVGRELKRALESYWAKKSSPAVLEATAKMLRQRHWLSMHTAGIDHVPSNDFSLYDHVLDMAVTLGVVPERYRTIEDSFARYFAMARGAQDATKGLDLRALEMTKWFDTNYHYIVPELEAEQRFELAPSKILSEVGEARAVGVETRPVILGPVTFLVLSKWALGAPTSRNRFELLDSLLRAYVALFEKLAHERVEWIQLDEPCLVLDLEADAKDAYRRAFRSLAASSARPKLLVAAYFGALADNLELVAESSAEAVHVDLVRAPNELDRVLSELPPNMRLSMGVVDGRNVWRTDLDRTHRMVRRAVERLGDDRVLVGPSCSLLHVPADLEAERKLDSELMGWLAFARQKLDELRALADAADEAHPSSPEFARARLAMNARRTSPRTRNAAVRARAAEIPKTMLRRPTPFRTRVKEQRALHRYPLLPTTTIGSFPQTSEVRAARAAWRAGRLRDDEYMERLRSETRSAIERQEKLGLDVLVHGEFERNDMVEYFGERLDGFAFTENGWVQSYGSRCVKPPLLYGDVSRPRPMTLDWSRYAQSLTKRPVKGMLTGPVTILKWSFVRDDLEWREVSSQLGLALRDEVLDLEAAGINVIQVDEPAIREGLPLRKSERDGYLRWAVDAFRLATSGVRDETEVHTHMCYAEFGDILPAIAELDADVVSLEASRSKLELLDDFRSLRYENDLGPGVYDIHSERVPTSTEMAELIVRIASVVGVERLWVNPDCGLKTRGWHEVEAALANMVEAARIARAEFTQRTS
jgi:5-methyltetrahydropteroyltriglutamate--homocysteine methyltransferase